MSESRDQLQDIRNNLGLMGPQFKAVFPSQQHVDRFIRVVMTAVQTNTDLIAPNMRTSLYGAAMRCAQDGLMPDGKEAAFVIYGDKINYQPMVEGMMKKLRNSGETIGAPKVHVWKEGDEFKYTLGDDEKIIHVPALTGRGKTLGAYSIVKLKSGDTSREVMSVDEINKIMERSRAKGGPWKSDFDEMARKTVFRRHYKKLPKSSDLDEMLKVDDESFVPFEQPKAEPAPAAAPAGQERPKALAAVAGAPESPLAGSATQKQPEPVVAGKAEEKKGPDGPDII